MKALEITVDEVRQSLRDYFAQAPGLAEVRANRDGSDTAVAPTGFDRGRWAVVADQVGLTGLGTPERWGGLGLDVEVLAAAAEECATSMYPGPVRAALTLSVLLGSIDPDGMPDDFEALIDGFLSAAVIPGLTTGPVSGRISGDRARFTGVLRAVTNGAVADLVVGEVDTDTGPAVAVVAVAAGNPARSSIRGIDLVTPLADIEVTDAPALLLGDAADLARHRRLGTILLAAEQVGGAEGALAEMVEYAKVREQFGVLIGTYQSIAHRCADTAIAITAARALVTAAAQAEVAGDATGAGQLALLARAEAADVFVAASDSYIQVSGGIGFTWEHDAHLFFRRARATAAIGGTPAQYRDRAVEAGCLDLIRT